MKSLPLSTACEFQNHWGGNQNRLMDASLFLQRDCALPPLEEIVRWVRDDPAARITSNADARQMDLQSVAEWFRSLPLEEAMTQPFSLAHFDLERFMGEGGLLADLKESFLKPWQEFLRGAGFSWERMKPYLFISGRSSLTPYHMDLSHVLAWQCYGHKRFSSLRDPERYAPKAMRERFVRNRATYPDWFHMPDGLEESEILSLEMGPGSLLWNVFLTPHWVASLHDQPAMSINVSHGGLKYKGRYCAFEEEARCWDPALQV